MSKMAVDFRWHKTHKINLKNIETKKAMTSSRSNDYEYGAPITADQK